MELLSGLDRVAWASLYGTYCSAEDVPAHLVALRSPDREVRKDALRGLTDAVIHQGTRWQVSSHVVPFLVELIDDPATCGRSPLMALLRDIGVGPRDDWHLPFDPEPEFTRFGAPSLTPDQEAMVVQRVYVLEEEFTEDWVHVANACAVKWDADAYRAAAGHVDAYCRWLTDDDPEVASRAAEMLTWFAPSDPTIAALVGVDGDDLVRASANLALAYLDPPSDTVPSRLIPLLGADSLLVRITAAIAVAHRLDRQLPDRALEVLADAKERETLPDLPPGWRPGAQRELVTMALQRVGLG